jgi:hypothetical protein
MAEWYRRGARDALNGMRGLTVEARGFYNAALDLIYEEEGPIWPAALRHELNLRDSRTYGRLLGLLIERGKLIETADGRITNERAMFEIAQMYADSATNAANGAKGGRKRALREAKALRQAGQGDMFGQSANSTPIHPEKANDFNGSGQAPLDHAGARTGRARVAQKPGNAHELGTSRERDGRLVGDCSPIGSENANEINATPQAGLKHIDEDSDIREESPPVSPPHDFEDDGASRKKSKRAQPLPLTWEPPEPTERIAEIVAGWSEREYETEIDKFTNHAQQNGRTCKDWNAAWRNWIIQADEMKARRGGNFGERPSGWLNARLA